MFFVEIPTLDEDECALGNHSCHSQATCINTIGSYTCHCDEGFTGNGTICRGIVVGFRNMIYHYTDYITNHHSFIPLTTHHIILIVKILMRWLIKRHTSSPRLYHISEKDSFPNFTNVAYWYELGREIVLTNNQKIAVIENYRRWRYTHRTTL